MSVPLAPCATDNVAAEGAKVNPFDAATVSAMPVVAVSDPEVPVMVIVEVPTVAVLLAVKVSTLLPVVGFVPKAAVTPAGKPEAAKVTLPANPAASAIVIVSVPLPPASIDRAVGDAASVKQDVAGTASAMVVVAVRLPDTPVIVTVPVAPAQLAALLAVNVSTLVEVVVLGSNDAITPAGNPDATRATLPANGLTSVTVIVSVLLAP